MTYHAFREFGAVLSISFQYQIHSVASESLQIEDIYEVGKLLGSGVAGEVCGSTLLHVHKYAQATSCSQVHSGVHRETSEAPNTFSARSRTGNLLFVAEAKVAIKSISKRKFLVNERSVTTTRVSAYSGPRVFVWALAFTLTPAAALCRGK